MHSIIREITYLLYKSQYAKKKERNETRKEDIWHETGNNWQWNHECKNRWKYHGQNFKRYIHLSCVCNIIIKWFSTKKIAFPHFCLCMHMLS